MNLTVRINGIEYRDKCVQGITFAEEYNETLDSGTIMLTHIGKLINLRPYDDVLIYDSDYDEKVAYANLPSGETMPNGLSTFSDQLEEWRSGGNLYDGIEYNSSGEYVPGTQPFYRHLLVDQFTENILNLSEDIYSYTIELMSETKGLEAIQCPNISVTQPLNVKKKINIYTYLQRYVELYSPKIKQAVTVAGQSNSWQYVKKYELTSDANDTLMNKFKETYSPDFTLSNPSLRDVLSNLMIVCDCIPYVKDGVIYAKDISARTGSFDIGEEQTEQRINYVSATMTSSDYCDTVRRQYSGALAQDGTCNYVEYLGFRNKNNSIMTLENLQVETSHPIYKINKMYMCYYKKCKYVPVSGSEQSGWFLCKQDITPLVKLDTEWHLLSQDWRDLEDVPVGSKLDVFAKYKLTTVCYSQGSNIISGWGTKYQTPVTGLTTVYDTTHTFIENILVITHSASPYGVLSKEEILKSFNAQSQGSLYIEDHKIFAPSGLDSDTGIAGLYDNQSIVMKGLFFQIDYTGFYNGALIHSRDEGNDNITHNDNSSSSLSLLEKDGLNQKEKLNRFANKTYLMKGRCFDMHDVLKLGSTTNLQSRKPTPHTPEERDDDVIIFRREYSFYNNEIMVSYAGINDYVLKNYFTSVFAKYRTYQLMSYGESVTRAENKKLLVLLSKSKKIYNENSFLWSGTSIGDIINPFAEDYSAFSSEYVNSKYINYAYLYKPNGNKYFVDEYAFTSGKSLCFNATMVDNISGGNYIKKWSADYQTLAKKYNLVKIDKDYMLNNDNDYIIGSTQDWYNLSDDSETGAVDNIGFCFGHLSDANLTGTFSDSDVQNAYTNGINILPSASSNMANQQNILGASFAMHKDNKEKIDMTYQIEAFSGDDDIVFSEWLARLSPIYNKNLKSCVEAELPVAETYTLRYTFSVTFKTTIEAGNYILIAHCLDSVNDTYTGSTVHFSDVFTQTQTSYPIHFEYHRNTEDNTLHYSGAAVIRRTAQESPQIGRDNIEIVGGGNYDINGKQGNIGNLVLANYGSDGYSFLIVNIGTESVEEDSSELGVYGNISVSKKIYKNMYMYYSPNSIDKTIEYEEHPFVEQGTPGYNDSFTKKLADNMLANKKVSDIFVVNTSVSGQEFINVDISGTGITNPGSLQFWYLNDANAYKRNYDASPSEYLYSYSPSKSGYKFVFGINVTTEDITRGYVKIYISQITNRDNRVYDNNGEVIGRVHNNAIGVPILYNAYDPIQTT